MCVDMNKDFKIGTKSGGQAYHGQIAALGTYPSSMCHSIAVNENHLIKK